MGSFIKPLYVSIRELSGPIDGLKRLWDLRWVRYAGLSFFLILWGRVVWSIYSDTGLFRWIGTDFALYFAQSTVLWSGEPGAIYRPEVFNEIFQRLITLYSPDRSAVHPTHVPYLPLFAWLFTPFTLSSPLVGFALWESLQLLAVIWLAWRVTQLFPGVKQTWVTLVLLVSFPVASTLIVGQPQLLLACAVAECYLSLRRGRDFAAGLWLALLLFKPQYGLLIGLVLIWKRRWAAIAGVIVGGIVIVGGSVSGGGSPDLDGLSHGLYRHGRISFVGCGAYDQLAFRGFGIPTRYRRARRDDAYAKSCIRHCFFNRTCLARGLAPPRFSFPRPVYPVASGHASRQSP